MLALWPFKSMLQMARWIGRSVPDQVALSGGSHPKGTVQRPNELHVTPKKPEGEQLGICRLSRHGGSRPRRRDGFLVGRRDGGHHSWRRGHHTDLEQQI